MKTWGVRYVDPDQPVGLQVRQCESRGHARAVLAGLPDHYLPAHVVTHTDGRWHPHLTSKADARQPTHAVT